MNIEKIRQTPTSVEKSKNSSNKVNMYQKFYFKIVMKKIICNQPPIRRKCVGCRGVLDLEHLEPINMFSSKMKTNLGFHLGERPLKTTINIGLCLNLISRTITLLPCIVARIVGVNLPIKLTSHEKLSLYGLPDKWSWMKLIIVP